MLDPVQRSNFSYFLNLNEDDLISVKKITKKPGRKLFENWTGDTPLGFKYALKTLKICYFDSKKNYQIFFPKNGFG